MDDWQRWTRRESLKQRNRYQFQYRYFPNRTPAQTFVCTLCAGFGIMGIAVFSLSLLDAKFERNEHKLRRAIDLQQSEIPLEMGAVFSRFVDVASIKSRRRALNLDPKPPGAVVIRDPDVENPEPRGQL